MQRGRSSSLRELLAAGDEVRRGLRTGRRASSLAWGTTESRNARDDSTPGSPAPGCVPAPTR